jgi:hypothetical protein
MQIRKRFVSVLAIAMAVAAAAHLTQGNAQSASDKDVTVVNTTTNPVPVTVQRTLEHEGMFFSVTMPGGSDPTLTVPAGVVLTDAHVTFSVPESIPNAASLIVQDDETNFLVYQLVNNTTFQAGVDLGSGIPSNGGVTVKLSCYNIAGNHCQGAIMWSGYRP